MSRSKAVRGNAGRFSCPARSMCRQAVTPAPPATRRAVGHESRGNIGPAFASAVTPNRSDIMPPIATDRLILRNFCAHDAADLYAYLHEPRSGCFLSLRLADMAAAEAEAAERSRNDGHIAVCLKSTDTLIGDLFAEPEEDTFSVGWNFNGAFSGAG